MPALPFCRGDRFRTVTWTLDAGTSVGGDYDVDALTDLDPSLGLWIEETTVGLAGDAGSAVRIDGVALIHHNFAAGTDLRLRLNATTPIGSPADITITETVGAWLGRWAPHVYFNVAAEVPVVANRTRRYLYLDNLDANTDAVQIGELVVCGQIESLTRGIRVDFHSPTTYGVSTAEGKKGPQYVHDRRSRDRQWLGSLGQDATDYATFKAWHDATYGVLPSLVFPLNDVTGEPVLCRFLTAIHDPTRTTERLATIPFELRELSCGEAY